MSSLQDLLTQDGFRRRRGRKIHHHSSHGSSNKHNHDHHNQRISYSCKPIPSSNNGDRNSSPTPAAGNFLCRDRRSVQLAAAERRQRRHASSSPTRALSNSSSGSRRFSRQLLQGGELADGGDASNGALLPEDGVGAVVSILAGYIGRFLKDPALRKRVRDKCSACLSARKDAAHAVLVNLQMGIDNIERLAATSADDSCANHDENITNNNINHSTDQQPPSQHQQPKDSKIRSLRNSIRLLSIVASLNSPKSRHGYTCGVPNAHLSACAQLYLAAVYKLQHHDRAAARHLLQVFCDAPRLARRTLIPDLWDRFFLPHLLHLRLWQAREAEALAAALDGDAEERERATKALNRVYNDQMDLGTAQFALYYKEWIKAGGGGVKGAPPPTIALPTRSSYHVLPATGKRSVPASPCPVNANLYQAIFGGDAQQQQQYEGDECGGGVDGGGFLDRASSPVPLSLRRRDTAAVHTDEGIQPRLQRARGDSASRASTTPSSRKFSLRFFTCRNDVQRGGPVRRSQVPRLGQGGAAPRSRDEDNDDGDDGIRDLEEQDDGGVPLINLDRAVSLISTSESLGECETAVRVAANAWLGSQGDTAVETALSTAAVVEGLLEVSFTSKDEEVLALALSLLAELVARSEVNRRVVLHGDPQLEIFLRLLANPALFLKTAVLLYVLRPKAKQMLSADWVPFLLRVLEHGDQVQTLFAVQCNPRSAAFYLLDQLLTGFDVDRNAENAKQVVLLGGLQLLIKRLEEGDRRERKHAASLLAACVRLDGGCREYLAANIKKTSLLELLIGNQIKSNGHALSLLVELVCLRRRTEITNFLIDLKKEGYLNAMHILLVYLQQAPPEQRPLVASILLQLDLLGDPMQYSICREEAIDAILGALDCTNTKRVQENCSKALLVLAGRFSNMGEPSAEAWLLKRAGLDDCPMDLYNSKDIFGDEFPRPDEEEIEIEDWLRRLASVLLTRGNQRFLAALSNGIANAVPCLARSCLVTVAWMSSSLSLLQNVGSLWSMACSALIPQLLESLEYDRALEERVLASLSLLNFARNSECLPKLLPLSRDSENLLQDLVRFTWTAKEILFLAASDPTSVIQIS